MSNQMTPTYYTPEGICSHCHGSGKVRYYHGDFDTCPTCHGTGKTEGIPVFVDREQRDGNTYQSERIEVSGTPPVARHFTGKISVPCAVPVRKQVMEWQPIETAPKDGTRMLLANSNGIYLAYWNPEFEYDWDVDEGVSVPVGQWTDDTVKSFSYENHSIHCAHPIHWMPLPDPPKDSK